MDVRAPLIDLSGSIAPLPQAFLQPVLRDRCAELAQGARASSLVQAGRDRIPADPGGVQPSPLYQASRGVDRMADAPRLGGEGQARGSVGYAQAPLMTSFNWRCAKR